MIRVRKESELLHGTCYIQHIVLCSIYGHVCRMRLSLKLLTSLERLYQFEDQSAECYWTGEAPLLIAMWYVVIQAGYPPSFLWLYINLRMRHTLVGSVQVVDSSAPMPCPTFSVLESVCPLRVVLLLYQLNILLWVLHIWDWTCTWAELLALECQQPGTLRLGCTQGSDSTWIMHSCV